MGILDKRRRAALAVALVASTKQPNRQETSADDSERCTHRADSAASYSAEEESNRDVHPTVTTPASSSRRSATDFG
jgi:hypothetical protein